MTQNYIENPFFFGQPVRGDDWVNNVCEFETKVGRAILRMWRHENPDIRLPVPLPIIDLLLEMSIEMRQWCRTRHATKYERTLMGMRDIGDLPKYDRTAGLTNALPELELLFRAWYLEALMYVESGKGVPEIASDDIGLLYYYRVNNSNELYNKLILMKEDELPRCLQGAGVKNFMSIQGVVGQTVTVPSTNVVDSYLGEYQFASTSTGAAGGIMGK